MKMHELTKEQHDLNNELNEIVDLHRIGIIGRDDAMGKIDRKLQRALEDGVVFTRDLNALQRRADNYPGTEGRHPLFMWMNVKKSWGAEKKACNHVETFLSERGEQISFENLDNHDRGRVRVWNYDCLPDVMFTRNGDTIPMDVKCLREQFFKWHDISRYVKDGAGMIVECSLTIFIYPPSTVAELYEHGEKNPSRLRVHPRWNKSGILISSEPGASYDLGELMRRGFVETFRVPEEVSYGWI